MVNENGSGFRTHSIKFYQVHPMHIDHDHIFQFDSFHDQVI